MLHGLCVTVFGMVKWGVGIHYNIRLSFIHFVCFYLLFLEGVCAFVRGILHTIILSLSMFEIKGPTCTRCAHFNCQVHIF